MIKSGDTVGTVFPDFCILREESELVREGKKEEQPRHLCGTG